MPPSLGHLGRPAFFCTALVVLSMLACGGRAVAPEVDADGYVRALGIGGAVEGPDGCRSGGGTKLRIDSMDWWVMRELSLDGRRVHVQLEASISGRRCREALRSLEKRWGSPTLHERRMESMGAEVTTDRWEGETAVLEFEQTSRGSTLGGGYTGCKMAAWEPGLAAAARTRCR